jgi:hypothetical protein
VTDLAVTASDLIMVKLADGKWLRTVDGGATWAHGTLAGRLVGPGR